MDYNKLRKEQGVQNDWQVCGNCTSYIWGTNFQGELDRHHGSCTHQTDPLNDTPSKYSCRFQLHALHNAATCKEFKKI